ncbi:MAG: Zn-ribbon domain-containing OB-fold protein [Candidatus Bathyarchaeota archaeon]|nr:MAG: Zn-ribbon domain-containing OB-fold protein [Candidatus Bathyarchaeota archaeon]
MPRTAVSAHWRKYKERYLLLGMKCDTCGNIRFPLGNVCPNCRRAGKIKPIQLSGKGKVYSYTVIRSAPEGFEVFTPYVIAVVELEEGVRITSQVVDCKPEDVQIGMPVEVCFRKIREEGKEGVICYGFKFRPTDDTWKP